jgi:transposase
MKAYSMDLRERVVAACDRGEGTREEIARRFLVGVAWVYRLLKRRRETGSIGPKPHGGGQRPAFDPPTAERLRQAVADRPDATLEELRDTVGVACGTSAVHRALEKLGLPRKKSRSGPPSGMTRI